MIPNLFFDLSLPEPAAGVGLVGKTPSEASFSDVIKDIGSTSQAIDIKDNNTLESGSTVIPEEPLAGSETILSRLDSEAFPDTAAGLVNALARPRAETMSDRSARFSPAEPGYTGSDPLLSADSRDLQFGNPLPPTGQSLPAAERVNSEFRRDAVSVAYNRPFDGQTPTAATLSGVAGSSAAMADVVGRTDQPQQTALSLAAETPAQAPKLIRTRVDQALREAITGAAAPANQAASLAMSQPEAENGFGAHQTAAGRIDMSAALAAARMRSDGPGTGGVSADLMASSTTAKVMEDQPGVRAPLTPQEPSSRDGTIRPEAARLLRMAARLPRGPAADGPHSRQAQPSPVAPAVGVATMTAEQPAELAAGMSAQAVLNAPDMRLKAGHLDFRRLRQPGSPVANPVAMTQDSLDAQRLEGTVIRPELQPVHSERPVASPGLWQPPANASENRSASSRANRSLAAAAIVSARDLAVSETANASSLVGTETARVENSWLRPEPNGQFQQLGQQVARQILFAHSQNLSQMRMQLNPEELGQLDLRLRIDGERVHVAIVTQQNGARDILEAQLPQLRSLLEQGGFELGDVDVRHQGDDGARDRSAEGAHASRQPGIGEAEEAPAADSTAPSMQQGIIDAFA